MTIEERRAELVAFIENEYGGQEVLKLADAYALAAVVEALAIAGDVAVSHDCPRVVLMRAGLSLVRERIEGFR